MGNNGYRKNAIEKGFLSAEINSREDMLLHINFIVGDPAEVAAQLNRYIGLTGVDQLDAMVKIPLLALPDVHESMRLLKREVSLARLVYDLVPQRSAQRRRNRITGLRRRALPATLGAAQLLLRYPCGRSPGC